MKLRRSNPTSPRQAFSLVEVLIALGIFSLALTVFLVILRQSIVRIERVQAEVFAILRAQHYGQKIDSKDILAWSGPEVESTMEERSTSGYRAFDLSCKGSYGTTKFLKIVPSKHLDWGEF